MLSWSHVYRRAELGLEPRSGCLLSSRSVNPRPSDGVPAPKGFKSGGRRGPGNGRASVWAPTSPDRRFSSEAPLALEVLGGRRPHPANKQTNRGPDRGAQVPSPCCGTGQGPRSLMPQDGVGPQISGSPPGPRGELALVPPCGWQLAPGEDALPVPGGGRLCSLFPQPSAPGTEPVPRRPSWALPLPRGPLHPVPSLGSRCRGWRSSLPWQRHEPL